MSSLFRICYPHIPQIMYRDDGNFGGITGGTAHHYISMLKGINHTFVKQNSYGDIIDHTTLAYDGCIGSMQSNQSDTTILLLTLPIHGPNLTQMSVTSADRPEIIASYFKIVPQTTQVGVMNMFNTFSLGLWLLILTYFSLVYAIILTSAYFRRLGLMRSGVTGRQSRLLTSRPGIKAVNIIVAGVLKQPSSCNSFLQQLSLVRKLCLCLTVFAFLVSFYMSSMIKTQKLTVKKPTVVETYADILAQDVRPLWLKMIGDHWDFERANAGTMEAKIWQKTLGMGLNESLVVPTGFEDMGKLVMKVTSGKSVLITSTYIAELVAANACAATRTLGFSTESFSYRHVDPGAKEVLRGFVQNAAAPVKESTILRSRIARAFEMSVMKNEAMRAKFGLFDPKGHMREVEECLVNRIVYPDLVMTAANLHHYHLLFLLILTSFLFATLIHFMDRM